MSKTGKDLNELPPYQLRIEGLTLVVDSLGTKPAEDEAKDLLRAINIALHKVPGSPVLGVGPYCVTREPMGTE